MKELENAIHALESITENPERSVGAAQLAGLARDCIELSRLECFLPGAYSAARTILEGIQATRLRSRSLAQQRMLTAVNLLRSLPLRE
ncbi:MAG TPA: hypothetical protein VF023_09830 [Bryobacteraceae bacterium]